MLLPLLFNLFINNLVEAIKSLDVGDETDQEKVSVLMYADDVVLIAETDIDLQMLLNTLLGWCRNNRITANEAKSKVVHFRTLSIPRMDF